MNRILRYTAPFAFAAGASLLLSACRSGENAAKPGDTAAANAAPGSLEGPVRRDSTGGSAGMQGMQGMQGGRMGGMRSAGMMSAGMMDSMQTHMSMMEGMTADRMKGMLPEHRQMVANMLSRMNAEMRQMGMQSDAKWTALTDSVRRDLVRMPDMGAAQLRSAMPAHGARVMRLMQMHSAMLGGMKK